VLNYETRNNKMKIKVRQKLLYYLLRLFKVDTDFDTRKPQDQKIAISQQESHS